MEFILTMSVLTAGYIAVDTLKKKRSAEVEEGTVKVIKEDSGKCQLEITLDDRKINLVITKQPNKKKEGR